MTGMIKRVFQCYGTLMMLHTEVGGESFYGFLHPVTSTSRQSAYRDMTMLGEAPQGQFVLLMLPDVQATPGDLVDRDGKLFLLRRLEPVFYQNEILYQWGLCVKKDGD